MTNQRPNATHNDEIVIFIAEVAAVGTDSPARPAEHRWSGWPGAWCFDCGQEDQMELCLADHSISLECIYGHVQCEEHHPMRVCNDHVNGPCLAPGQMLADPYAMNDARRQLLRTLSLRAFERVFNTTEGP